MAFNLMETPLTYFSGFTITPSSTILPNRPHLFSFLKLLSNDELIGWFRHIYFKAMEWGLCGTLPSPNNLVLNILNFQWKLNVGEYYSFLFTLIYYGPYGGALCPSTRTCMPHIHLEQWYMLRSQKSCM